MFWYSWRMQIKFVLYKVNGEETSISQLSGGQKTLVGLAFLCALACYRKFPFYLLGELQTWDICKYLESLCDPRNADEVDAALDQQNQHRCARLVRHTLGQSQVICISHHKAFFKNAQTVINVKRDKNGNTKIDCWVLWRNSEHQMHAFVPIISNFCFGIDLHRMRSKLTPASWVQVESEYMYVVDL